MHRNLASHTAPGVSPSRVLLVADWTVDPHAVVAAAIRRDEQHRSAFGLLVPAWLHGLDWAGDPGASAPCAQRQLDAISTLTAAAGLAIARATVGDPDPATAILDALEDWSADELLLCVHDRRLVAGPLDLAHRTRRLTGLPVRRMAVPYAPTPRARRRWLRRRNGHCTFDPAQLA